MHRIASVLIEPFPRRALLSILALILSARIVLILLSGSPELFEYHRMATNLLTGQGYVYVHLGTPYLSFYSGLTYIGLTTLLYACFPPGELAVLVAQSVTTTFLCLVVFWMGKRLWSDQVGLLAAALTGLHPALAYYDTQKLHPLSLDALFSCGSVLVLLWALDSKRALAMLIAGLTLGLGILQRGTLLPMLFLAPLWVAWVIPKERKISLPRLLLAYWMGALLILAPWIARNTQLQGAPMMLSTTPQHLWLGNHPAGEGSHYLPSGKTILEVAPESFKRELALQDEQGQARLFTQEAVAQIQADPIRFARNVSRKFLYFWTMAPQTGMRYPPAYRWIYGIGYTVILLLAGWGLFRCLSIGSRNLKTVQVAGLIGLLFLSVSLLQSLFYVELRHRWAIEPLLLLFASVGLLSPLKAAD